MGTNESLRIPETFSERLRFIIAVICSVGGQTAQNIAVPMLLSNGSLDVGVMLCYSAFCYFAFFTIFDVILSFIISRRNQIAINIDTKFVAWIGFENAMNGCGVLFGGSPSRTPLPLQMTFFLVCNQFAPLYKIVRRFGCDLRSWRETILGLGKKGWIAFGVSTLFYTVAMLLVLSDNLAHRASHPLTAYCLCFIGGTAFATMYNVDQDIAMENCSTVLIDAQPPKRAEPEELSFLLYLKRDVMTLRLQTTWLFLFSWLGVLFSLAGGSEDPLTQASFERSWALVLPFGNTWMNVLNGAYIITFFGNIYINRYDASFTMIISNIAAVSSMWTGWIPSMEMRTVLFYPNIAKTVIAMVLSLTAVIPSWIFSKTFKNALDGVEGDKEHRFWINGPDP